MTFHVEYLASAFQKDIVQYEAIKYIYSKEPFYIIF